MHSGLAYAATRSPVLNKCVCYYQHLDAQLENVMQNLASGMPYAMLLLDYALRYAPTALAVAPYPTWRAGVSDIV
eukprot:2559861-Rhodomonas_salina.1